MIVDNGKYYLYRHIRLDKNEPFYVGIGTKKKSKYHIETYIRAHTKYKRGIIWQRVTEKTKYEIEIVLESDDRAYVLQKEKEFIKLYGRMDIKTGTLANLTDGGEGGSNKSREQLDKELITRKKTGSYQRNKERWIKWYDENLRGKPSIRRKMAYIYNLNGSFHKSFSSMSECAEYVGMTRSLVCKMCREKIRHSKYIFSDSDYRDYITMSDVKDSKWTLDRKLVKLSRTWEMLEIYKTTKIAGELNGFDHKNLNFVIKRKIKYRQHNWRYINNGNNSL